MTEQMSSAVRIKSTMYKPVNLFKFIMYFQSHYNGVLLICVRNNAIDKSISNGIYHANLITEIGIMLIQTAKSYSKYHFGTIFNRNLHFI